MATSDEDLIKVLSFISEMSETVKDDDNESFDRHKEELSRRYRSIHETTAWSENAQIIFDMGTLLFEADLEKIDKFHTGGRKLY